MSVDQWANGVAVRTPPVLVALYLWSFRLTLSRDVSRGVATSVYPEDRDCMEDLERRDSFLGK